MYIGWVGWQPGWIRGLCSYCIRVCCAGLDVQVFLALPGQENRAVAASGGSSNQAVFMCVCVCSACASSNAVSCWRCFVATCCECVSAQVNNRSYIPVTPTVKASTFFLNRSKINSLHVPLCCWCFSYSSSYYISGWCSCAWNPTSSCPGSGLIFVSLFVGDSVHQFCFF